MYQLIDSTRYEQLIDHLVHEISFTTPLDNLVFIGIQRKGDIIAERIKQKMNKDIPLGSININLYRDDLQENNQDATVHKIDIPFCLKDKHIIIVDDVLYTGRTIRAALNAIFSKNERPKSIKLAVLIDRGEREIPVYADFIGHTVNLEGTTKYIYVKILGIDDEDAVYVLDDSKH